MIADKICILDNVQFADRDFIHRNKIKSPSVFKWLSVPVNKKNHHSKNINQIEIIKNDWAFEHLKFIQLFYKEAPYFDLYFEEIKAILVETRYDLLIDLDMALIKFLFNKLEIDTKIVFASTLAIKGKKSDLILAICKELETSVYFSGQNGRDYLALSDFDTAGIDVAFQDYQHPQYPQLYSDFLPYMSVIDLLFNCGPKSRNIILIGNINEPKRLEF